MDVLGSLGQVELNLFRTQTDEERKVRALASGLRVVSASDDPSGYAIAQTIQTKVSGLQQGVQNTQTANNLLSTADATLATVQEILSRIHSLIVEASSDFNSTGQLQSIQDEIGTLLKEVDKIASDANFNGVKLFDGSLATQQSAFIKTPFAEQVNAFDQNTGPNVYDANDTGGPDPGPMIFAYPSTSMYDQPGSVPGLVEFQITGYSTNPVDPVAGPLPAPGVYVQITQYSTDPNFNGTGGAQEQISTSALITGTGPDQGTGTNLYVSNADGTLNMLRFDIANLSPQDVGTAIAFETFDATPAADTSGHALSINSNGTEGGVVQVSLPSVSASALGLSSITVLPPQVVDWQNNILGTANNAAATADAEGRVQNALDAISYARAQVGAQSVSLQEDAGDASLDIVNQIASESAIRDVNVAQTTSDFVKDQLLTQIGVSMISQMQVNAQLVVQLLSQSTATSAPAGTSPGTSLL